MAHVLQELIPMFFTCSLAVLEHGLQRRPSLHSASVHISSLAGAVSNPQPWQVGEDWRKPAAASSEALSQDYLSPIKLMQLAAEPDLSRVSYLELSIDTTENGVGNFGKHACMHGSFSPLWESEVWHYSQRHSAGFISNQLT